MTRITDCLIVAAGKGTRLQGIGSSKPLVKLAGTPLIEHAMRAASLAGVEKFVVVTGYQAERLTDFLKDLATRTGWNIVCTFNPKFEQPNGISVLCGQAHLPGDFYLAMCDHFVEPALYQALASAELPAGAVGLGVDLRLDNPMVDLDDVTKIELDGGRIRNIGKELTRYNAFDCGIFRANTNLFQAIQTSQQTNNDNSISGGMKTLAAANQAIGIDIGSANWIDVDSAEMHKLAENWIVEQSVLSK